MSKVVPIDRLHDELKAILEEYGNDVAEGTSDAVRAIAKKGAKAVRAGARASFGGTGKYASGWTFQIEESRLKTTGTIYNKHPGLPHLLEKGHAKRGGGRVAGRAHIAPVEAEVITELQKAIEEAAK